ncbi:DUF106 domain-containing protein [Candidatus Woesearchaeota archaeon]|nr:DUF106 domain-containing protein [Candidatus Woesearchaeota archaeon]
MVFENLLNPIFSPLLNIPPVVAILIISFLISFIITIVYKYMTDQTMMKDLKTRQKEFQKKMKALRGEPEKLMKVQREAMEVNMQYMKQSFKPTLITFLPIIIIFGWLNAHMAYEPIMPGQEFPVTLTFNKGYDGDTVTVSVPDGVETVGGASKEIKADMVTFRFTADEGDYLLVFEHDGTNYDKELTVTTGKQYATVTKIFKKQPLRMIETGNQKLIAINLFSLEEGGWSKGRFGWLATYIIFSLLFSLGLRKILKIY